MPINKTLMQMMESEDDMGMVLKSHVIIEKYLHALNESLMKDRSIYRELRLSFMSTVKLSAAIGLNNRLIPVLRSIDKLRNKYAHSMKTDLTKNDVNNIIGQMDEFDVEEMKKILKKSNEEMGMNMKLTNMEPGQKFIAIAIYLVGCLYAECKHVYGEEFDISDER